MAMVPALDFSPANDDPAVVVAPSNIEAEQALLGALLYDNSAMERIPDRIQAGHFYEPFHQRLFAGIEAHIRKGQLAEPILLAGDFEKDPAFEELGGIRYLADLVDRAPPAANAPDYARAIYDLALRRELIRIGGEIMVGAQAIDPDADALEQVEQAEQQLYALVETGGEVGGLKPFADAADAALERAAMAYQANGALTGLSTGITDLDSRLGGLHPSHLLILAGRPSMGKTALATNIAFHVARNYAWEVQPDGSRKTTNGGVVAFFSLEMSEEELAGRILAEVSGVSGDETRKGKIDATAFGRIRDARDLIRDIPLHIDATGAISLAKLAARARRMKRRQGLDLIVVDYLQLVTAPTSSRDSNRVQEISAITAGLKALAKDLGVPVIALSQLSRKVEDRPDKRPQLADLRESGSIEQDADVVAFVYREAYYLERAEPRPGTPEHATWADDMSQVQGLAEVIIGKQRHGPIGTVRLAFNSDTTKFGNLAREGRYDFGDARLPYGDK